MKTLRVVTVLASLLLMTGCTTAQAIQETPSPTFSSAGKEVITETKKAAKTIQEEAIKAAEKASEEMAKKHIYQRKILKYMKRCVRELSLKKHSYMLRMLLASR